MQNCCYFSVTPLLSVRNNSTHSPYPLCVDAVIDTHIMTSRQRGYDQTARTLWRHYLTVIYARPWTELRCVRTWAICPVTRCYHLTAVPRHFETYTHTYTHTYTNIHTHTNIDTHTQTYIHTHTNIHTHKYTYTYTHGISQEKNRINPSMGQLMDEGGCPMVKWHPLCSIWWRTKVKAYYSHVCVRT